jgi:hypothetical protein
VGNWLVYLIQHCWKLSEASSAEEQDRRHLAKQRKGKRQPGLVLHLSSSFRTSPLLLSFDIIPHARVLLLNLTGIDMRRCIIYYLPVFLSQFPSYQTLISTTPDPHPAENTFPAQQDYDNATSNAEYYEPQHWEQQEREPEVRSRIPLIVLAQQNVDAEISEPDTRVMRPALSTITERTERTEANTPHWRSNLLNTPRPLSSTPTSSYGEVIGMSTPLFLTAAHCILDHRHFSLHDSELIDPNLIPVSPSGSALHRLSTYERAPSLPASESRSAQSSPRLPSVPSELVPSSEEIPSIPDYNSKSSKPAPFPVPPPKKSKLSMLATSRASSVTSRSQSSRSSGIALTGSVKTFPALRPSAQSARPPNSTVVPSEPAEEVGENAEYFNRTSLVPSSTSSHVRRAIQTALNQEVNDQENGSDHPSSPSRASSDRSKTPTPSRPVVAASPKGVMMPTFLESQPARLPSKLALLAQAKADASKAPRLPKPTTEYLTPIANGPTVTTAITTSYQSLYSLTDPSRSPVIPKQHVVPLSYTAGPPDVKRSKLAMKIKKANEIQYEKPGEEVVPSASPIFYPKPSRVRASPSAFASLLIDDILTLSQDKDKRGATHSRVKEQGRREKTDRASALSGEASTDPHESHRNRARKLKHLKAPDFPPLHSFAFDSPSPDDIVFNARRGTSMGQRKDSPSTSTPRSPGKSLGFK